MSALIVPTAPFVQQTPLTQPIPCRPRPCAIRRIQRTLGTVASTELLAGGVISLSRMRSVVLDELVRANYLGVTNSDVASLLGLRSDYGGGSKVYLSFSVLGILMRDGKVRRESGSRKHLASVR